MKHKSSFLCFAGVLLIFLFVIVSNSNIIRVFTAKGIFDETPTGDELLISTTSPNNKYLFNLYNVMGNALNSDVYIGELVCENKARTVFRATKVYELDKLNIEWKNENTIIIGGGFNLDITQKKYNFNGCDIDIVDDNTAVVNSIELDVRRDEFNFLECEKNIIAKRQVIAIGVILSLFVLTQAMIYLQSPVSVPKEGSEKHYNLRRLKRYLLIDGDSVNYIKKYIVCLRIMSIGIHMIVVFELLFLLWACLDVKYILLFEKVTCICFFVMFALSIIAYMIGKRIGHVLEVGFK